MGLTEGDCKDVKWIELIQDNVQCPTFFNMAMNLLVPQKHELS